MRCPAPPEMIEDVQALDRLVAHLHDQRLVAVDTESNSMHAYHERVCLIQMSTGVNATRRDFVIDPLAFEDDDLDALADVFANPEIEVVFHAAEYDVGVLKRDFGFEFNNVFDTYVAARTLGWERVGLASILNDLYGISVDKRYQQADWGVRPLSDEQLCYAQLDTHYLIELRHLLFEDLTTHHLLQEAREYFLELCDTPAVSREFDPDGFWRLGDTRRMSKLQITTLREMYFWRERMAERMNVPPFKVMKNHELVVIALKRPQNVDDLRQLRRVSSKNAKRYGKRILQVVHEAAKKPHPKRPRRRHQPDPIIMERYDALHRWRKEKARERGVESDIIISKSAMWALAHEYPTNRLELQSVGAIGPIRREKYADEILEVLANPEG